MKKFLTLCLFAFLSVTTVNAQTIYSQNFASASGFSLNVSTGINGPDNNFWKISANEGGVAIGGCAVKNNGNNTLHITSVFNPVGGANYDAGGLCGLLFCPQTSMRAESPFINCTSYGNLFLSFHYIENGSGTLDNFTLWYFNGTSWSQLADPPKTSLCGGGQGLWTNYTIALPANANNNSNVKIGFNWINNDDGIGTSPSVAIDDILIYSNSCTPTTDTLTVSACNSYTWAAKNNTVYTASNNTDTIHLTNVGGCDSLVTLNLTIKQSSTSNTNISVCSNALPYVWNNYAFNIAGAHTIHLTNAVGCDSAATLNLTINQPSTSTTNTTICASSLPYTWNGLTFNATGSQTYHTNNSVGCDSAATLNLTVLPLPTVNAGADTTICPSGSSKLTATGAVSYSWTGGITNGTSFSPAATTTYIVTGTSANGCSNTDTVIVTIRDLTIASITPVICKGVADTLTAPSGSNYQWKKNGGAMSGKTSRVISLTVIGSYTVTYTDSLCGVKTTPAVVLTLATPPAKPVLATTKAIICPGDTTTLFAVTAAYKFIWLLGSTTTILPGVTSQSYHTATIGSYYIKAVDSFGCRSAVSGAKVIKAGAIPVPVVTIVNGTLGSKKLTCTNSGTYQWRLNGNNIAGATSNKYIATQTGAYSVRLTNSTGCVAISPDTTLTITYTGPKMNQEALAVMNNQEDIKVYPNPSSDIFYIEAPEATKAIVTDLQGRKVLETNDTHQINLKENPSGIYFLQLINEEGMLLKTEKLMKQ